MLTAEAVAQGLNLDKTPRTSQPESSGSKGTSRKPRIKYDLLPSQQKFHDSETKFKGFSGPVGSGKSVALCHEALRLAFRNAGRRGLIGAPTYPMLRDVTQLAFLDILEENGVPYRFRKSENSVFLPGCGSTVLFRALDYFERLRGTNLAWFGVDEATYCKEGAWLRLEARLRDPKAGQLCGFGAWTPKGFDWVYQRFIGPEKKAGYEAILASPRENKYLGDRYYEDLGTSYDEKFFKQEVLGEYLNLLSGRVYYAFDRRVHTGEFVFDPMKPLLWSLDFNVNPMCSVIGQLVDDRVVILDELFLPDSSTSQACDAFYDLTEKWSRTGRLTVYVYGDASGANRKTAGKTDWEIVRGFFKRNDHRFRATFKVPQSNPLVRDRVNTTNASFRTADGPVALVQTKGTREVHGENKTVN